MTFTQFRAMHKVACLSVLSTVISYGSAASAQDDSIYGERYHPVENVVSEQAQVILFRSMEGKEAAHVYVDGELESALMPGGYTAFCVNAGQHSVETFVGDAPLYAGKRAPQSQATLDGGKTYFLEVAASSPVPLSHNRTDAERALQDMRLQIHIINRASSVVACKTTTQLSLRSDVLFRFGKSSYSDLTPAGHAELRKIAEQLNQQSSNVKSIDIVGHADPIGNAESNIVLSQARAGTVRRVLLESGIRADLLHASGRGSSEPVVNCTNGSRSQRIACNEPNRRVELIIHGEQSAP